MKGDITRHGTFVFAHLGGTDFGVLRVNEGGLGNLLFPWARAVVLADRHRLPRLRSVWPQIAVRHWVRWDVDKRTYHNLFSERDHTLGPFHSARLRSFGTAIAEDSFWDNPKKTGPGVVVTQGIHGYFSRISADHPLVRSTLWSISRPEHRPINCPAYSKVIGVHVRLGDFDPDVPANRLLRGAVNARLSIGWYVNVLRNLRARCPARALLFSDGRDSDLAPLLSEPGVARVQATSSLAELWMMSYCGVLIASGSTYSMWASYLGRMPVVWHAGQRRQSLYVEAPDWETEATVDGAIDRSFLNICEARLAGC